jgi:Tol biopolymer transport system component
MPDLREVFEMVKQQTEPDQDSWAEQERRIRQAQRKRKYGALALVAALVLVIVVVVARDLDGRDQGAVAPSSDSPSPTSHVLEPGPSQLSFLDLDSGATTGTGLVPGASEVDVSPDGTEMTYVDVTGAVKVAAIDSSDVHPFLRTMSTQDPTAPRWSPDGTKIVYQRGETRDRIGNLFVLDVASGRVEQITNLPQVKVGLYYMAPTFSSDGRSVLFTLPTVVGSGPDGRELRWDLWTVPASGGEATLLVENAGFADAQPNGDSITFVSLQGGSNDVDPTFGDVYVARSDGTNAHRVAEGEAFVPRWSPDGSEIAFSDSAKAAILVVDVATGDIRKVYDSDEWPEWVDQHTLIIDLSD